MLHSSHPRPLFTPQIFMMDPEIEAALSALTDSTVGSANRVDSGHPAVLTVTPAHSALALFAGLDTDDEGSEEAIRAGDTARRRFAEVNSFPHSLILHGHAPTINERRRERERGRGS
jgi:hypothetical protein